MNISTLSKGGTGHFIMQRVSALVLIPLIIWFCFSIASLPDASYSTAVTWLSSPFNMVLMLVTLIAGFYHGALGIQAIFEDYISKHSTSTTAILISKIVLFLFAALGVFSIIKIAVS